MSEQAPRSTKPQAVLFACGFNSVRSPMAVGLFKQLVGPGTYVVSAGVRKRDLDPFAVAALEVQCTITRMIVPAAEMLLLRPSATAASVVPIRLTTSGTLADLPV